MTVSSCRRIALAVSAACLLLSASPARAADGAAPGRSVGFLLRMGFDFGGEKLADVRWDNGDSATLRAGQLISFAAGAIYRPDAPWALEATIGYKFDKANASNGTVEFTRVPLDVVVSYANGPHRIGAGPTIHFSPKFRCDAGGLCNESASFGTSVGGIVQYAYGFRVGASSALEVGARFTFVQYSGAGLKKMDGSAPGFFFGGWL